MHLENVLAEATQDQTGPVGFLAMLFIGAMTVFLIFDMVRRIRRTKMREEIGRKLDAEQAEANAMKKSSGK